MQKRKRSPDADTSLHANEKRSKVEQSSSDLMQLLDVTLLSDSASISCRFDEIANLLLREFELVVKSSHKVEKEHYYKILELEFYLWKKECHEDPFTHGSEEQRLSGQWYFHRVPRNTNNSTQNLTLSAGYRGGSRKGLDLTFGGPAPSVTSPYFQSETPANSQVSPTNSLRGGILLRSIQRAKDEKIISGPSLLVDELLSVTKASSIADLVDNQWNGNIFCFKESDGASSSLTLRRKSSQPSNSPTIYRSPRIGLDLSNQSISLTTPPHPRVVFVAKQYRYFTNPNMLTANGRHQSLLGVLCSISPFPITDVDDQMKKRLSTITGIREATVQTYLDHFISGYKTSGKVTSTASGLLSSFIGAAGKGVSSNPARYLKMMGHLIRMDESSETSDQRSLSLS